MEYIERVLSWLYGFLYGGGTLVNWLLSPIVVSGFSLYVTPLELLSISGLTTFLLLAIGKWVLG